MQLTARVYESGLLDLALERSGEARKPQALVTGFTRVVIIQMPGNINLLTFIQMPGNLPTFGCPIPCAKELMNMIPPALN